MNKLQLGLTGLAALTASLLAKPTAVHAEPDFPFYAEDASEYPDETGVESKVLGCFVSSSDKPFFEKNYKRIMPKVKNKKGLKEAYCIFAVGISKSPYKELIHAAIDKMKQIGAAEIDPVMGYMYLEFGFEVRRNYFTQRDFLRNWVEIYAAAASPEEAVEKLNERNRRMDALENVFDEAAGYLKKGVGIIVERGMHDEGLRNAAVAACKAIDFHARHNYDWEEVRKYEAIRRRLEK